MTYMLLLNCALKLVEEIILLISVTKTNQFTLYRGTIAILSEISTTQVDTGWAESRIF